MLIARRLQLALLVVLGSLALAAPAHATLAISAPAQNATIAATIGTLPVKWTATCPDGKTCGEFANGTVYPNVRIETTHATIANANDVNGDAWAIMPAANGAYGLYLSRVATGGAWKLTASWQECTSAIAPALVDGATCATVTTTRNYTVPLLIGTKDYPPTVFTAKPSNHGGKLQSALYMGCNGPASMYRANLEVLKRVKVRGVFKWVSAVKLNNQAPTTAGTRCDWSLYTAFPSGITNRTQLRSRFTIRAVGMPKVKAKVAISKVFTRASLSSGGGGSIVIG